MLKRAKSRSDPALCFAQFLSCQDCGSATHETIRRYHSRGLFDPDIFLIDITNENNNKNNRKLKNTRKTIVKTIIKKYDCFFAHFCI